MFDVTTAIALNTISHLACAAIMGLVWWKFPSLPGVKEWAVGRGLLVLSFFLFLIRSGTATPLSVIVSNAVLLTGIYSIWTGNCRFMGRTSHRVHLYFLLLLLLVSSALFYFSAQVPDYQARATIISACIIFYAVMSVWVFWPRGEDDRYVMAKMMIATHTVMAALHLFRGGSYLLYGIGDNNYLTASLETKMTLVGGMFVSILTTAAALALLVEFLHKELLHAAQRDPLTGAYNRRAFFIIADNIYARSKRNKSPLAVLSLDLDYFKKVNDLYGHKIGDKVLQSFVSNTQNVLRSSDILARFGGEEFVVILPETGIKEALTIGERIRSAIREQQISPELALGEVTCSVGVAAADVLTGEITIETLIERSDKALYQSKIDGRNQVSRYGMNN